MKMTQQNSTFFILLPHPTKTIEDILVCTTIQQTSFSSLMLLQAGQTAGNQRSSKRIDPSMSSSKQSSFVKLLITSAKSRGVRSFGLQSGIRKEHYVTFGAERSNYKISE